MRYFALLVTILCCHSQLLAQRPVPVLSLKPLVGNIYLLDGGLGNVTMLISDSEILMVDTKTEEAGEPIEQLFKTELAGKKLRYIINTHNHFDHTGSNDRFATGTTIIAHRNSLEGFGARKKPMVTGLPTELVDSAMTLHVAGEEIRLIHYPHSHTDHDLVVYFPQSKVIAMGDMYFSGMYPFIATDGDLSGLIANLGKIIEMLPAEVKIVPGHGPVSTLDDLKSTRKMLMETSSFIRQKIDAGKSLESIKHEGLPQWTSIWGNGFCKEDCWIETVYEQLSR